MLTSDIKTERRGRYAPKRDFEIVDVPELAFLMIDGHGDPNTAPAYRDAIQALYTASYAIRAAAKAELGRVHPVGPLEGLWSAADWAAFRTGDKDSWDWTMMIGQPDWIPSDLVGRALAGLAGKKPLPALGLLRFERFTEGRSVQILHLGPYDGEGPTLARLHGEFLPAHGLLPRGRHHEIYLSDPRRTEPNRLRTILRQPVTVAA